MNLSSEKFHNLWEETAKSYTSFDESYYPTKLKMDLLKKFSNSNSICLDIGIANGIFSIPLSKFVTSIDGIDISQKMLGKCKEDMISLNISNIKLHNRSAEELPFDNKKFDLIFSYATLSLVPNIEKAFLEIERTIKPGGFVIMDITGKNNLSRTYWEKYYCSIGHFGLNSFSLSNFKNLIQSHGFDMVENHSIGLLDQWKYIPGLNKIKWIEQITHAQNAVPDFDYICSQLFPELANHWITVVKKK
jgi:ubiquinone/menaquinone biosynthesis C-methylase UbiE